MTDATATGDPTQQPASAGLPVFYSRPEALNPSRHARLRLVGKPGYDFARTAHAIPVMAAEMPAAMRSYPIVFVGEPLMPVIVTGIRNRQNLFVGEDGAWSEPHYVPGYVRRYPFVLAGEETAERLTLCIDRDSDRVVEGDGGIEGAAPLFEDGEPSEATRKVLAFCEHYQAMLNATRAVVARVAGHGLFAQRQSNVKLATGEEIKLTDFQVIDEDKLGALADEAFLDLRRAGALPLVYCHLASMNSWPNLLHQAGVRHAAAGAGAPGGS